MSSNRMTHVAAGGLGLVLFAGVALGQTSETTPETEEQGAVQDRFQLVENLQDVSVVNAVGEEVGEVANLIVQGNEITHVIISIGGFLGMGGSDVVVPFDLLSFDGEQATIGTIASSDQIESLVPFDPVDFGLSE